MAYLCCIRTFCDDSWECLINGFWIWLIAYSFTVTRNHNKLQYLIINFKPNPSSFTAKDSLHSDWTTIGPILVSLSLLIWTAADSWFTTDFILIWMASYIAYPYPRKCFLISRIHGNIYRNELFVARYLAMALHVTLYLWIQLRECLSSFIRHTQK
jgi:hypothetical protein